MQRCTAPPHSRLRAGLVALACGVGLGCGGESPASAAPPFQPIVDTQVLMHAVLDPHADVIWDSVGAIDTLEGSEELRPRNEEEWDAVRSSAVTLAEAGNLLMMAPRAVDQGEWYRAAQALIETSVEAISAADRQDPDALFEAGGHIYNACTNCHQKYWSEAPARP